MPDDLIEELVSLPSISVPTLSPDGSKVAMYSTQTGRNELHVLNVDNNTERRWSNGEVPQTPKYPIYWGADSQCIYFHKDEGGDEQNDIYAINSAGETECVVSLDGQAWIQDVGNDGETLLLTSTADGQMNLYVHSLSKGETERITDYDRAVMQAILSPDSSRIAFGANESDSFDNVDVYIQEIGGPSVRKLDIGEVGAEAYPIDWEPEGDRLLVQDTTPGKSRAGVVDVEDECISWLGNDDYQETPVSFLPGCERVLATRTRDAADVGIVLNLETGTAEEFDLSTGVTTINRISRPVFNKGKVLVSHETPTSRTKLIAYNVLTHESERVLEAGYGNLDREMFREAQFYTINSDGVPETPAKAVQLDASDELEIECLLYDSGNRPSPLIVNPHGGPSIHEKRDFGLYTQFLLSQGYSVLQMNYRGSAGHGQDFRKRLFNDWGGTEQGDIASVTEATLERREWLDEDRVVVLGTSYGGYSAYWQMVQYPDLYAGGIANVGMTDLRHLYQSSMPHFRTELLEKYLGDPNENSELYEERSPITHAGNLSAPLLMIHGVNDPRVPVSQAHRFRDELLNLGYGEGKEEEFEFVELDNRGHGTGDIKEKETLDLIDGFLERRLNPGMGPSES